MIVEDKWERIKCSFIEMELPFQQEASCSSTENNRFIRRKASLARKPPGSDAQPRLLKLGRWSHDNQDQRLKRAGVILLCFFAVSYQRKLLKQADDLQHYWGMSKASPGSRMYFLGHSSLRVNTFRNTVKIIPLFFAQHIHTKRFSLKSEHPHGYCGDTCVTSYLLIWNGITDSIYGWEATRKTRSSSTIAAKGNTEIQAHKKLKGSGATWHPVAGLAEALSQQQNCGFLLWGLWEAWS